VTVIESFVPVMMDGVTHVIDTCQLNKKFGSVTALRSLDLQIKEGEIYGLLGPNGSGKTTTLRLLMGFLRPTSGSAQIAGLDCWHQSLAVRGHVGYLPGELRLYPSLSGHQIIRFFARLRRVDCLDRARQLANHLELDLNRRVAAMSTGMRQKLGLILVLAHPGDLLILDEPTSGLDPTVRLRFLQLLREAQAEGCTILFSSHVISEVEQVCHRAGLLCDGELVTEERLENFAGKRRIVVEFASQPPDGAEALPGVSEVNQAGAKVTLSLSGPMGPLLKWLEKSEVSDMQIEPDGLLSLYRQVHGKEQLA
jgi:ABC-2 type transport system ATP-binding protein